MISEKKVAKNMLLSIGVQVFSLLVGFILNLIVPKYISELDYSNWQTFLLYSQYLSMLHFGFLDGFILRYSQYDYNELDKKSVRTQYYIIMLIDFVLSIILVAVAFTVFSGTIRVMCILLSLSICIEITFNFVSFAFQTTNRIKEYAKYVFVFRGIYCVFTIVCLVFGLGEYYWFCIVYLLSVVSVIVYFCLRYNSELFIGRLSSKNEAFSELKTTLFAGIWLMISAYAANFLVDSGKMIIQWKWDQLVFGKISLAFSLTSFVLQFVTAISVVLFPSMKRMDTEKLPDMYMTIRNTISPILFFALVFYFPGSVILRMWLPKYNESIIYLGILMPIIIYTSKVSLLTNNYLKAYRKERQLFIINVASVICAILTFLFIAYVIKDIKTILVAIVFFIMLRSIVSEIVVTKLIGKKLTVDFIVEILITAIFIVCVWVLSLWTAFAVYFTVFILYCIWKRKEIGSILLKLKRFNKKSQENN